MQKMELSELFTGIFYNNCQKIYKLLKHNLIFFKYLF